MQITLAFIAYMLLFFSVYKIYFFLKSKMKNRDLYNIMEIIYLKKLFKIDVNKNNINRLINLVALSNSFIFSVVLISTMVIYNFIIRLLVMLVLLMPLTFLVYYGVGTYLQKRGNEK